jgi:hypothetical protein
MGFDLSNLTGDPKESSRIINHLQSYNERLRFLKKQEYGAALRKCLIGPARDYVQMILL